MIDLGDVHPAQQVGFVDLEPLAGARVDRGHPGVQAAQSAGAA